MLDLIKVKELKESRPSEELIPGLLDDGLIMCVAPEGSGKTFFGIHCGVHVAAGQPWKGKPVTQGVVVYCIAEGVSFFPYRVTTAFDAIGRSVNYAPFYLLKHSLNLRTDERGDINKQLVELSDSVSVIAAREKMDPKLIIFDTLNRFMPGGNENNQMDAGALVNGCEWLRDQQRCSVMLMHHMRKDRDAARGSTVLTGAADQVIVGEKPDDILSGPVLWTTKGSIGKRKDRDPVDQWFRYVKTAMSRGYLVDMDPESDDVRDGYVLKWEIDEETGEEVETMTVEETLVMEPCEAPEKDATAGRPFLSKTMSRVEEVLAVEEMGIKALAAAIGKSTTAAYRALDAMEKKGMVRRDAETKKWRLAKASENPFE